MTLTELDRAAVQNSFDRAAGSYEKHAVLQQEVELRLLERLEHLNGEPKRILDFGCGTGKASHYLQEKYPQATVVALDWSPAMLQKMLASNSDHSGPMAVCADMHGLPIAPNSVDVLFSNLAVQWTNDLEALLQGLRAVIKPGGMLLFSTFGPDTLHELRSAWSSVDDGPHVNQFADMHDIGDAVVAAGFVEPVFDIDVMTLEYQKVMDLMKDLKAIGAHNVAKNRNQGLTGKQKFAGMLKAYEPFRKGDIYPATYEVVFGVAFGPQEGQPIRGADGEIATFSVDALVSSRGQSQS